MSQHTFTRLGAALVLLTAALFLGTAGDGGCGAVSTDEPLCSETGGTWGDFANWPGICAADGTVGAGPATNGEKTCACPGNRPNWENGIGCVLTCPQPQPSCKGVAKPCDEFGMDREGCERQTGCDFRWNGPCGDKVVPCNEIDSWYSHTETQCRQQVGCTWGT